MNRAPDVTEPRPKPGTYLQYNVAKQRQKRTKKESLDLTEHNCANIADECLLVALLRCVISTLLSVIARDGSSVLLLCCIQTMGGDFLAKGRQDCSKGIYVLAGQ